MKDSYILSQRYLHTTHTHTTHTTHTHTPHTHTPHTPHTHTPHTPHTHTHTQVLGKLYSILSDKEKRAAYDEDGTVDEEDSSIFNQVGGCRV